MYEYRPISDRVARMRALYRDAPFTVDCDRAIILTESYKRNHHKHPALKKALSLYDICSNWHCRVEDDEVLVCNLGKYYKGTSLWPEYNGLKWLFGELESGAFDKRSGQDEPMYFPEEERQRLFDSDIRAYWAENNFSPFADGCMPEGYMDFVYTDISNVGPTGNGHAPSGHLIPNYRKVIEKGFGAVRAEAQAKVDSMRGKIFGNNASKYMFYRSVVIVCDAFTVFARRYADACRAKAEGEKCAERKAELLSMADGLDNIATEPARNFREACQATILYQLYLYLDCNYQGLSLGRFDQYTWPCLEKDLAAGTFTMDDAMEIVDNFWLKCSCMFNARTNFVARVTGAFSTFQHITLGGCKIDGTDGTNPVTFLGLESPARLLLHEPPVSLRVSRQTPDELFACAFESSKRAGGIPCFQNEDLILESLMEYNCYSLEDARDFGLVGCQEIGGSGNDYSATGGINSMTDMNLANILLLALNNGTNPKNGKKCAPETGYLYDFKTLDELLEAVKAQFQYAVDWYVTITNVLEEANMRQMPIPALSCMLDGCMESGTDCVNGGAKYNSTGCAGTGVGTIGESLAAIKYIVYDAKIATPREFYDAVMANWEGYEELRQQVLNSPHKYGNGDEYADEMVRFAMHTFSDCVDKAELGRGRLRLGLFTASSHVVAGTRAWATPDGRFEGISLSDCISPVQGADKCGPTAVMRSACCFDHKRITNGMALNIRFSPKALEGADGLMKLRDLMFSYFDLGGMEVQYNIVSSDTLRDAMVNPDEHRNLVVRVAGFSAYFVELNPNLQRDMIARTENSF